MVRSTPCLWEKIYFYIFCLLKCVFPPFYSNLCLVIMGIISKIGHAINDATMVIALFTSQSVHTNSEWQPCIDSPGLAPPSPSMVMAPFSTENILPYILLIFSLKIKLT